MLTETAPRYYRTKVDTEKLRALHRRSDMAGWLRVLGHLGSLAVLGSLFYLVAAAGLWWLAVPVLLAYGVVFSFLGWVGASHELQHSSVFEREGMNQFFLRLFTFLSW